ncbi:MAG: hypothetical protein N7Q72_01975 [Spiroplasma sp. Tabriz.8]|nr:hypothetical protein [Spiroplasma sp. Tabriz.8]
MLYRIPTLLISIQLTYKLYIYIYIYIYYILSWDIHITTFWNIIGQHFNIQIYVSI